MPSLGADMESGTLVQWKIHAGDSVKHGDVVAEGETEKGLVEIEIFEDGVVEEVLVQEGQKVPIGTVLALIRGAGPLLQPKPEPPAPTPPAPPVTIAPTPAVPEGVRRRISPLARKRAEELGVDIVTITGSGEAGAITVADIERAAVLTAPPAAKPPVVTADQTAAMRHAIATAMARSKREIPHYYLATTVDMSRVMTWLEAENLKRPITDRLLYSVLLLRAMALAVREVPEMNGHWIDGAFQAGKGIHIGVAISLRGGGLVAPAIHDVDQLSVDDLSRRLLDLVKRARAGVLRGSEISDATITVTNLGEQGVETVFGVIYPPQVALVGFGKISEQARAVQGMIGVHRVLTATLAADHRTSDGHRGGRFLAAIDRLLQEPEKL